MKVSQTKMRLLFLVILLAGSACVELPETTAVGKPRPPPEIGTSITHTRLCSCRACGEASCCSGLTDADDAPQKSCGSSYDFSQGDGCGMQVGSCASRCFERSWRVKLSQECDAKRPPECCGAGP
ncbi:MAG: hypothetical protein DYH12_24550 [Sorangiineae bacterium PRO1]|nr:hypothetical protein [Sorangiineae bacterium PRO1]